MQFQSSFAFHLRNLRRRWNLAPFSSSVTSHAPDSNSLLFDFLRDLGFQKSQAVTIAKLYPNMKSLEKPRTVIELLKSLNFSNTQIQNLIRLRPHIIFCKAKKNLEPKLRFFQDLGFSGSSLAKLLTRYSSIVNSSLERRLIPSAEILKSIVAPHQEDLTLILYKCGWLLLRDPNSFLIPNISYLKTFGIVRPHLFCLLKRRPRILILHEEALKKLVSRTLDLEFSVTSGMFVCAMISLSGLSKEAFDRKVELFVANGFSVDETKEMIRRAPGIIRCADEKLKMAMELYMKRIGIKREDLVKRPVVLTHGLEKRVIPRVRVLLILKDKGLFLLKKEKKRRLFKIVGMTEKDFLERFVLRFGDEIAKELKVASNAHLHRNPSLVLDDFCNGLAD